ncbi:hypothetical protein C0992_011359 [Termitomyces sp. T32_za158]|nr:hypothetical protein C0992_011359 [Termitomyces sp. T32_za158]
MDVDPLADTVPPRYAVESDEEDEINPLPTASQYLDHVTEVKLIPDNIPQGNNLVIATGEVGKCWAPGTNLGVQIGGVYVNKVQVCDRIIVYTWERSLIQV